MKIIKNLHIIHKDKFDKEFIEFVNSNFEKEDHFFLVIHLPNTKKYDLVEEEGSNILNFKFKNHKNMLLRKVFLAIQVVKFYGLLLSLSLKSKRIFFHNIADYQILFLYIFRNFLKKSYYVIWSTEKTKYENNHIFNKIVKYVKGNFRGYITHIRGDYEIMKERYKAKGERLDCFSYPSNLYKEIKLNQRKDILNKLKNKQIEADNTIRYGAKKVTLREIKDIILARTGDIIDFITTTIDESGFNGHLTKGIVLTGGAVEIDGVSEQIATRSGYLTRKMSPIPLKGLRNAFYSDAVAIGIFLEDMEREYKAYLEESRQPAPTVKEKKEKIKEEITLNNKINNDKMDRKEEIDSFLEEVEEREPEKEPGKIRSFFRWFGELF